MWQNLSMPLLDENLSLWKISFRWAGLNPDSLRYRFYIPHTVKDNMRLLLNAIMCNSLFCRSLQPKFLFKKDNARDQKNLDRLHDVISDSRYDRNFMQSHYVWRADFAHWCNRLGMPFPEFWFPVGWTIHELSHLDMLIHENPELEDAFLPSSEFNPINNQTIKSPDGKEDIWSPLVIAAQTIWADDKALHIADVVRKIKAMKHLKASAFSESAIRKHIRSHSPTPGKRGRKPSKKLT